MGAGIGISGALMAIVATNGGEEVEHDDRS
jgi:hypothetical protein